MADLGQAYVQIVASAEGISGSITSALNPEAESAGRSAGQSISKNIGDSISKAGTTIGNVGKTIMPLSVAAGALFTGSAMSASGFNDAMAKMSTLFDTSQVSVSDLSDEFINLSNKTGLSATELADAGYQALSAGQSIEDVGGFVETAGNLAKAGFTSTTTAVDVLTTAMNAYGENAGTADEIANKLVRTQNLGKTTVDELASSMGKIIPTASSMGVNIDNLTSGYVSLTKQGIGTAEATTYMNGMLNELGKSSTTAGKLLKEKTGKSFQELMDDGNSLADVLQIMKDSADESGVGFNELWGSAEAGKAGLAILNGGVEEFNGTVKTMASDTDDVGSALEKLDTPSAQFNRALNNVKNSGIQLGTSILTMLAPALEKITGVVQSVTQWFSGLSSTQKTVVAAIIGVIAVAGPLLTTIAGLISAITTIHSAIVVIGPIIAGVSAPILGIVAAVAAAVVAGILLYKNWDKVKAMAAAFVEAVKAKFEAFKTAVSQIFNNIRNAVVNAVTTLKTKAINAVTALKTGFENRVRALRDGAVSIFTNLKNRAQEIFEGIKSKITEKITSAKDKVVEIVGSIKEKFEEKVNSLKERASQLFEDIKEKITKPINDAKDLVNKAVKKIKNIFPIKLGKIFSGIKLPHFKITGGEVPWGIGGMGKRPTVSIDWYKKAMNNAYVLDGATIFGQNASGNPMGGGEAGREIIIGEQKALDMIARASGNRELIARMNYLIELLEYYLPQRTSPTAKELDRMLGALV